MNLKQSVHLNNDLFIYLFRLLLKEEYLWHMQPKQYTGIWT